MLPLRLHLFSSSFKKPCKLGLFDGYISTAILKDKIKRIWIKTLMIATTKTFNKCKYKTTGSKREDQVTCKCLLTGTNEGKKGPLENLFHIFKFYCSIFSN